jgi:hypothetical protein
VTTLTNYHDSNHNLRYSSKSRINHDTYNCEIHQNIDINKWQIIILNSVKSKSKTEKKIAKDVKLNRSIVAELITDLIQKGYVLSSKRRRLFFFYFDCFSTTLDGLSLLEEDIKQRNQVRNNNGLLYHILAIIGYWHRQNL